MRLALSESCLACRLPVAVAPLCEHCRADLPWLGPLPDSDGAQLRLAALPHRGWPRQWVHALKFHGELRAGRALGLLLAEAVADHYAAEQRRLPELIVPVPLHWFRQLRRGRNQAATLGRVVGRSLGLPLRTGGLTRTRATAAQQHLDRAERLANLATSFRGKPEPLAGIRHLALVDDVYTTGATTAAVTAVLQACGVHRVDIWCATYTEPPTTMGANEAVSRSLRARASHRRNRSSAPARAAGSDRSPSPAPRGLAPAPDEVRARDK